MKCNRSLVDLFVEVPIEQGKQLEKTRIYPWKVSGIAGLAGWSLLSGEKLDMQETRQRMTGTSLSCCKCILLVKNRGCRVTCKKKESPQSAGLVGN